MGKQPDRRYGRISNSITSSGSISAVLSEKRFSNRHAILCLTVPHIERFDPDLVEEMRGVAGGTEMDFEEVVALNCQWELNYAYMPPNIKGSVT